MTNSQEDSSIPETLHIRVIPLAMSTVNQVLSSLQKGIFKSARYGGEVCTADKKHTQPDHFPDDNAATDLNTELKTQLWMGLASFAIVMRSVAVTGCARNEWRHLVSTFVQSNNTF